MCMKRGTCFATRGRGVKFRTLSRKRELCQEMDLCSLIFASLNVKVHSVLTMLSPLKPGYNKSMFVFDHVSHHLSRTIVVLSSCSMHANALQYADVILTLCKLLYIHTNTSSVSDCCCQD